MADDVFMETLRQMLYVSIILSLPVLGAALVVGLVVGLLQAVTSIQEQTLSFVPKLFAIVAVLVITGPWMLRTLTEYGVLIFGGLPRFGAL
ncbi:MAG: flagellar biosynthesis protein FliQ [Planctomycetes bacterium]|jgi:flagellar biosynthetic protein FliQ|nr:flagellar biosynthesis protein FliQ [Planctomycetota bacterium]